MGVFRGDCVLGSYDTGVMVVIWCSTVIPCSFVTVSGYLCAFSERWVQLHCAFPGRWTPISALFRRVGNVAPICRVVGRRGSIMLRVGCGVLCW